MGNRLSFDTGQDPPGPGDEIAFFRNLNIQQLGTFVTKVKEIKRSEFDIKSDSEKLQWIHFFGIISDIKDKMTDDIVSKKKANWHPATLGYAMMFGSQDGADDDSSAVEAEDVNQDPPDDFTEDDASDIEEEFDPDEIDKEGNDHIAVGSSREIASAEEQIPSIPASPTSSRSSTNVHNSVDASNSSTIIEDGDGNAATGAAKSDNEDISEVAKLMMESVNTDSVAGSNRKIGVGAHANLRDSNTDSNESTPTPRLLPEVQEDSMRAVSGTELQPRRGWNPALVSPIFYGRTTQKAQDAERAEQQAREELRQREARAIAKAQAARGAVIDALERTMQSQQQTRIEKIAQLEARYAEARTKRAEMLERSQREMLDVAFKIFERQWEEEEAAAEFAYETEMSELRRVHAEKSGASSAFLEAKRSDMEAFKDAEKQQLPAAERLEAFARVEVSRAIDELEGLGVELEQMRLEYREMKADFDSAVASLEDTERGNEKAKQRKVHELRSLVGVAEGRMRSAQRRVAEGLEALEDAELLLDRAVRIRRQQDELLPLFSLMASSDPRPSECGLNSLVISLVLLIEGTFEQKYNFLFRLFDSLCEGTASLSFIVHLLSRVQAALHLLHLIPSLVDGAELLNMTCRAFYSIGLDPSVDVLTEFELKQTILHLVSHSHLLCRCLGICLNTQMQPGAVTFAGRGGVQIGTYQRSRMGPLALLSRGMINSNMCKLRLHNEAQRFRPQLETSRKQQMHERAMLLGQDDPLKADYSKFLVKKEKVEKYRVDPLDHGHLSSLLFVEQRARTEAATKIQSLARAVHDRRVAELAARRLAFMEAKEAAMKEMKAKVVREFKKREAGKGMGKMKWDAQVRMKQAKLRTLGQSVGRSDTVMIMMEEAITAAKADIEQRFEELEAKEAFHGMSFERNRGEEDNPSRRPIDITAMFGLLLKPSIADKSIVLEEKNANNKARAAAELSAAGSGVDTSIESAGTGTRPRTAASTGPESTAPAGMGGRDGDAWSPREAAASAAATLPLQGDPSPAHDPALLHGLLEMNQKRTKGYVLGKYLTPLSAAPLSASAISSSSPSTLEISQPQPWHQRGQLLVPAGVRGEFEMELELRRLMASPEAEEPVFLFNRLRSLNIAMTAFKTKELLAELPTKRLLLKFWAHNSDEVLRADLAKHFKFKGHQGQIIRHVRNWIRSDLEQGTIRRHLFDVQRLYESGMLNLFEEQMTSFISSLGAVIELRLQTNEKLKEEDAIEEELQRVKAGVARFQASCHDQLATIEEFKAKFERLRLSFLEMDKKRRSIQRLGALRAAGADLDQEVPLELRQNWVLRVNSAAKKAETSPQLIREKYSELRNVCREFLDIATSDAVLIINEIYQPKFMKTIPVCAEHVVDGRPALVGRGVEGGRWYEYEAHNIEYKVCLDYDGVFNGSDEYAAKAGGLDRLGAQEYFKLQVPRLQCPLVATVDYLGFRVLAVSKLPIQNVHFNEEGEVRKLSVELVHGVQQHGDVFVNKSKIAQNLLKIASRKLNLAEHMCKGAKDIGASSTFGSSEIKIYQGSSSSSAGDNFYLQDFWRAFPPEAAAATPHLRVAPRDQAVFWRHLRPEFVSQHSEPLSPDACCSIVYGTSDGTRQYERVEAATRRLVGEVVPQFLQELLRRTYRLPVSEGMGINIGSEMHVRGINVRHLGLMRSLLWRKLPGTLSVYHHEKVLRTNQDLRLEVRHGDRVNIAGTIFEVCETRRLRVTHNQVPLSALYMGESVNGITASAGAVDTEQNNSELRLLFLAEMLARTIKATIRLQMRMYNQQYQSSSAQFFVSLVCEYLNVVTGSSPRAQQLFEETFYDGIKERFGNDSVRPSERTDYFHALRPAVSYVVSRLISMLGLRLCITCEAEFSERPSAFVFSPADVLEVAPVLKHNIPTLPYADAVVVSLEAAALERELYTEQVLQDAPSLLFLMSERRGARVAANLGSLGQDFAGSISRGCELEHPGPVVSDRFIRAYSFRPNAKSYVDVRYDAAVVPPQLLDHFSFEAHFCCRGGTDSVRVVLMSGRYALLLSRDNNLTVAFYDAGHEVRIRIEPVEMHVWKHVVGTYDGTTLRTYVNGVLAKGVEVEEVLKYKTRVRQLKAQKRRDEYAEAQQQEQEDARERSRQEALQFFQTKEGVAALRKISRSIMESDAFQEENIGANARDQATAIKEKRLEALKRAKAQYMRDHYQTCLLEIAERYVELREELEERLQKELSEGREAVKKPLRIGAAPPSAATRDGSYFFNGDISCVSVFPACLPVDRVKMHHMCCVSDRRKDAQRLHGVAASKFELALRQGPPQANSGILSGFAKSLCSYLRIDTAEDINHGRELGKLRIMEVIEQFSGMRQCDGIAELLGQVPRQAEFADIATAGFLALQRLDPNFFSKSLSLQRKDLVHLPFEFGLVSPECSPQHWEAAAYLFREVVRDVELMFAYGDLDLRWLPEVRSASLVISLVKAAQEDKNLRHVAFSEVFAEAGMDSLDDVTDEDVLVLSQNLAMSESFDLNRCTRLTNSSIGHLDRMKNLKALVLDHCVGITDEGLGSIRMLHHKLQVLSLEGLLQISDSSFLALVQRCDKLVRVNVNKCPNITYESIIELVRHNKRLSVLQMSSVRINDEYLSLICAALEQSKSKGQLEQVDISYCRELTDLGVVALAETCTNLRALNLAGLSRVSDVAIQQVCGKCWYLQDLNLEDLFLLSDSAFWFSATLDGRSAANEHMLTSLRRLNLTDCSNLTDRGVEGLAERCRQLLELKLRGCDKITDLALEYMSDPSLSPSMSVSMCDSIRTLHLAYSSALTAGGILSILPSFSCLEELDLSGLAAVVTDGFVQELVQKCPTVLRLVLQKCILLTDAALCSVGQHLYLERLDLSGCHRVTDVGVEVLSEACTGLRHMVLRRVKRITDRSVFALTRNCRGIRSIDVQECTFISAECVEQIKANNRMQKLIV